MSVIESPDIYDRPGENGTFAIVQLDPVASVAAMKDARATEAASKIPRSKYLVIIETIGYSGIELSPGVPKLEFKFLQVGRGLPPDAWAASAVSPAPTQREDRPPLVASSPLPWPDCYIDSFGYLVGIISRLHKPSAEVVCFTVEELDRAYGYTLSDQIRLGKGKITAPPGTEVAKADSVVATDAEGQSEVAVSQDADLNDFQSDLDWDSDSESSWAPLHPILPTRPQSPAPYQPEQMNLHVEMWLDLSTAHELCPPYQIVSDLARLRSIEDEWARRKADEMVTKRPQTTAWLEHISTGEEPPDDASIRAMSDDGLGDDWDVAAEDAIDERAERARAERRARRAERQSRLYDMQSSDHSLYDDEVENDDEVEDDNSKASDDEDQPEAESQRPSGFVLYHRVYLYVREGIRRAWTALRQFLFFCSSNPTDSL
ncbi:hypothetical protein EXIGLDRAFT_736187 [Exidia glandulosa HHB12029]|uniref:Uncharacterized protein n=1 Tax=Exidia glandulosa HHB12029 TaxID=1314781 RepID=A0A165JK84_EXIGL|nr:hypothetical protein EXIGLDRAFT_736187 [Exidia glandulosa HHB12029]